MNRIERDFVFEHFMKDKPDLVFLNGNRIFNLASDDYLVEGCFVIFECLQSFTDGEVQVIFEHKKRAMFIFVDLIITGNKVKFEFPHVVFKYDETNDRASVIANLILSSGANISVKEFSHFPLNAFFNDLFYDNTNTDVLRRIKFKLLPEDDLANDLAVYRVYNFLLYYERYKKKQFEFLNNLLLFVDDKLAVVFLPKGTIDLIFSKVDFNMRIQMYFPGRQVSIEVESVIGCMDLNKTHSILAFSCEKAKTEDKRFLFERVYNVKYGG
ncbi:MAG: hypothetical protein CR988_07545 [Treponema sp.]|nr:MAG: hypothetical protein CR988_07545 [Treponema sp.]